MKLTNGFLNKSEHGIQSLQYLIKFQEVVGVVIVVYVLTRYIQFLIPEKKVVSDSIKVTK